MTDILDLLDKNEKKKKTFKDFMIDIFDIIAFLVFVLGIVLIIRIFFLNPFTVVGDSMSPTFKENDFIIVDKLSPRFSEYERGDIVVFVPPSKNVNYIKRIIGLPGETVKLKNGNVYICNSNDNGNSSDSSLENCNKLEEPYLPDGTDTLASCGKSEFEVKKGTYFVLGDNRDSSTDSRCCFGLGCNSGNTYLLDKDNIMGEVFIKLFPGFDKFG